MEKNEKGPQNPSRRKFLRIGLAAALAPVILGAAYNLSFVTTRTPIKGPVRVVFLRGRGTDPNDYETMKEVCEELDFVFEGRDYRFMNDETSWFDETGLRKFHIVMFPGGHSSEWFAGYGPIPSEEGINKQGCENIKKFIRLGGSCWAICLAGISVFAESVKVRDIIEVQTEKGVEFKQDLHTFQGKIVDLYGGEPLFKGTVIGPQERNWPYPRVRFLPIKLNGEHPIIKRAREQGELPDEVYLSTVASPSLIPDEGEPMEVVGWFPNGSRAIGIVKYGNGHLFLVPPHVSQTYESVLNLYIRRWENEESWRHGIRGRTSGISERECKKFFDEGKSILLKEGDPDGRKHDRLLAKAMLINAATRASLQ